MLKKLILVGSLLFGQGINLYASPSLEASMTAPADSIASPDEERGELAGRIVKMEGRVTDKKTGESLAGVTIIVNRRPSVGTVSDIDGHFSINAPEGATLKVQYLGYETRFIKMRSSDNNSIRMSADNFKLNEVVVTGQGAAITKRRISSNVSSIKASEMPNIDTGRLDKMLQGTLPNVQFNIACGQPGTTSLIKSRGLSSAFCNSTPIIYVDGVRVDNSNTASALDNRSHFTDYCTATGSIGDIPMENIEKIEYVPGGAATTLYGSDAANGVIQIFTKKGGDHKTRFFAQSDLGVDVAQTQYYHFKRTGKILHRPGFRQKYRFGFDGGTENYGYSFAGSMGSGDGIIVGKSNKDKKYDMRFGSHMKFGDKVRYSNSFGMVAEEFHRSRNGNQGEYNGLWFLEGAASCLFKYKNKEGKMTGMNPDLAAMDDYQYHAVKDWVKRAEELQDHKETIKRFQTSHSVEYKPLHNLTMKATLGLDYRRSEDKNIVTNAYRQHTQQEDPEVSEQGSIANIARDYFGITADLNAQYRLYIGESVSIISTGGFQYFSTYDHQVRYDGKNLRDGSQIIHGAGTLVADEWLSELYTYGAFLQENIGVFDKYYIDLGIRGDYNTGFGDDTGWQYYPKVGLSYVMSDEPFMEGIKESGILTNLRIMANYGVAGNMPPAFENEKTIKIDSFDGSQAASFGKYGNTKLGPEKKHSYELGFNSVWMNGKINLGFTYYYTLTRDALFRIPSLPSEGLEATYLANVGKIRNSGTELFAKFHIINTRDWKLNIGGSWNTMSNKVLDIGASIPFGVGGFSPNTVETAVAEGESVGFIRGNRAIVDKDGKLQEIKHLQNLGKTLPTGYGSFNLDASYKNWDLTLNGDYQYGSYVHSFDRQFRFYVGVDDAGVPASAMEQFKNNEGIVDRSQCWLAFTNYMVEKADYIKLRDIGIAYNWKFNKHLENIRLGFNIYNPLAWTSSKVDPEAVLEGSRGQGAATVGGINYATWSSPRQYVASVRINF